MQVRLERAEETLREWMAHADGRDAAETLRWLRRAQKLLEQLTVQKYELCACNRLTPLT